MKIRPVILCGGAGTRLWPNKKKHQAKQFIDFGNWTLLGKTLERVKAPIFDDPIIFSLKLAEFIKNSSKTLGDFSNEIPSYPYEELKFKCPDSIKFNVNEDLEKTFTDMGYKVETIDGVKIWLEGGWVLLRPSNTQPVIRMFVEATDNNRLMEIKSEFKNYFDKSVEKFID